MPMRISNLPTKRLTNLIILTLVLMTAVIGQGMVALKSSNNYLSCGGQICSGTIPCPQVLGSTCYCHFINHNGVCEPF
jgi:UPF0716 family protein affecting phage T7 exclusion